MYTGFSTDVSSMDYAAIARAQALKDAREAEARRLAQGNKSQAYSLVNQQIADSSGRLAQANQQRTQAIGLAGQQSDAAQRGYDQSLALAGSSAADALRGRQESLGLARQGAATTATNRNEALDIARRAAAPGTGVGQDPDSQAIQRVLMGLANRPASAPVGTGAGARRTAGFAKATDLAAQSAGARALQFAERGVGGVNAANAQRSFDARNLGQQQADVQQARQAVEAQYANDADRGAALQLQQQNQDFQHQLSGASAAYNMLNARNSRQDNSQQQLLSLLSQGQSPDDVRLQQMLMADDPAQLGRYRQTLTGQDYGSQNQLINLLNSEGPRGDTSAQNQLLSMLANEQFTADDVPVGPDGRVLKPKARAGLARR